MVLDTPESPASVVAMKIGICVMANIDEIGFFYPCRKSRLRFGLGARQPDAILGLLRGAGVGGTGHADAPPRARNGNLWHTDPAGAGGGDGDLEPASAGPGPPWHRYR